jgi:sortase A
VKISARPIKTYSMHTQSLLRWGEVGFWLAGLLTLGYCAMVLVETACYQSYQNWHLQQILKGQTASFTGFLARWVPIFWAEEGNRNIPVLQPPNSLPHSPQPNYGAMREDKTPASPGSSEGMILDTMDRCLIGRLEIPRIGFSAIVMEGVDAATLRHAAGHIPGTALPGELGNVGIAGHRDTFFRELGDVCRNDIIKLTAVAGSYEYRVESFEVVEPSNMNVLESSGQPMLTLVTCYPFHFLGPAPKRFIIHAQEIARKKRIN